MKNSVDFPICSEFSKARLVFCEHHEIPGCFAIYRITMFLRKNINPIPYLILKFKAPLKELHCALS